MKLQAVVNKYSKALFEVAAEKDCVGQIIDEFGQFLKLSTDNKEIFEAFDMPNTSRREKILSIIIQPYFSAIFFGFLTIVVKNKRHRLLPHIFDDLRTRHDLAHGRVKAQVTTAIPLTGEELLNVERSLGNRLQAKMIIENLVDPAIIGGMIIRINGRIFNASIVERFRILKSGILEKD